MRMERLTQTFKEVVNKTSLKSKKSEKLYDCSECGELFMIVYQFNQHIDKHHQEEKIGEVTQLLYTRELEANQELLTEEKEVELTMLHQEEMAPSQKEMNWMLQTKVKNERKILASKYFPKKSDYKIEEICEICNRYFYTKGNIKMHMVKEHSQSPSKTQSKQTLIKPHESWLSKSLFNLEDLLSTVPSDFLVCEEDEIKLKLDFKNIMHDVQSLKVISHEDKKPTFQCNKCKFNATSMGSLNIHTSNVHDQVIYRYNKCRFCVLSHKDLSIHKKTIHPTKGSLLVIKKSLNIIKDEAGGLSNPKRGQAINCCKQ